MLSKGLNIVHEKQSNEFDRRLRRIARFDIEL